MYLVGRFSTSLDHNASLYLIRNVINFLLFLMLYTVLLILKLSLLLYYTYIMIVCAPLILLWQHTLKLLLVILILSIQIYNKMIQRRMDKVATWVIPSFTFFTFIKHVTNTCPILIIELSVQRPFEWNERATLSSTK